VSTSEYEEEMSHYFKGYVILSLLTVGVSLTCNLLGKGAGARSRALLHQNFLERLLEAPLNFFESTPIGRILGRASADVAVVDRKLVG
jgi:ABC-type multidrug transport system fused ATPase/permease subunit